MRDKQLIKSKLDRVKDFAFNRWSFVIVFCIGVGIIWVSEVSKSIFELISSFRSEGPALEQTKSISSLGDSAITQEPELSTDTIAQNDTQRTHESEAKERFSEDSIVVTIQTVPGGAKLYCDNLLVGMTASGEVAATTVKIPSRKHLVRAEWQDGFIEKFFDPALAAHNIIQLVRK